MYKKKQLDSDTNLTGLYLGPNIFSR